MQFKQSELVKLVTLVDDGYAQTDYFIAVVGNTGKNIEDYVVSGHKGLRIQKVIFAANNENWLLNLINAIADDSRNQKNQALQTEISRLQALIYSQQQQLIMATSDELGNKKMNHWPEQPPELSWAMADHTQAHKNFEDLLTRDTSWSLLRLSGPTNTGKSTLTKQMLQNALSIDKLACGRYDFKGASGLGTDNVDNELHNFTLELNVEKPSRGQELNVSLSQILESLKNKKQPVLLIFDTYEAAENTHDWVERQLLTTLIRSPWIRVVIAGQELHKQTGTIWEGCSCPVIKLQPPTAEEWYQFAKPYKSYLTLDFVKDLFDCVNGNATLLKKVLLSK